MTLARPLKIDSNDLKEMSDADMQRLRYNLRRAYADQLNSGGKGYIYIGSGGTSIGSKSDTSHLVGTGSLTRGVNDGVDDNARAAALSVSVGTHTDNTYQYRQDRTVPSYPSNASLDSDGYVRLSGTDIQVEATEANFYDTVIADTITEMRSGDEVGTYRVSTSTPSSGGAGTWYDKGTFFVDTTYSGTNATYKYWLKMDLSSAPGSEIAPTALRTASNDLQENMIGKNSNLVQNVLLPVLTRRLDDGDLQYTVQTGGVSGTETDRGTFNDTRLNSSTSNVSFSNPTYTKTVTPSGSAANVQTHRLVFS